MSDFTNLPYDIDAIRADFPILSEKINGKRLAYLDSGASAQKPHSVLAAMTNQYQTAYANVHRGAHTLSALATDAYEAPREKTRNFINAGSEKEIIYTSGATESINLVANSWGRQNLTAEDEVILSVLEHHSNIVPWQLLQREKGFKIKVVPIKPDCSLDFEAYQDLLSPKTKLVALSHMSNVFGTGIDAEKYIAAAHHVGAKVLLDGCQAIVHQKIDVQQLDVDFYAFSSHKLYGPTGFGILYGKQDLLEEMPPFLGGGEMIATVSFTETSFAELPHKFEAGTPAIVEAVGFGAALDYVNDLGQDNIQAYETMLLHRATETLRDIEGIEIFADHYDKGAILSFRLGNAHPHDVATILDQYGVAVRAGHHCAQPAMDHLNVPGTVRASFALYNHQDDIQQLAEALIKAKSFLE